MKLVVSFVTKARDVADLKGLVYGVTAIPHEAHVVWYMRPMPLSVAAGVLCIILNIIFW